MLMAMLPLRPRLFFFGPKEEDMLRGGRNRLMTWTGSAIPYKPGKNDLLEATRKVVDDHRRRRRRRDRRRGTDPPPRIGAAAAERGRRVLRDPVGDPARPDRHQRDELAALRRPRPRPGGGAVRDERPADPGRHRAADGRRLDGPPRPGRRCARTVPPGRFGRWLTELFNEWPEGSREAALAVPPGGAPGAGPVGTVTPD